jgi:hypothetical protein
MNNREHVKYLRSIIQELRTENDTLWHRIRSTEAPTRQPWPGTPLGSLYAEATKMICDTKALLKPLKKNTTQVMGAPKTVTYYALEITDQPGHYIAPVDRPGVLIFNSVDEAEQYLWKLDAFMVLVTTVKPVTVADTRGAQ